MSKFSILRKAIELRLRRGSNLTVQSMKRASACIAHLQLHGCVVKQVTVRRDHVTIDIDDPSAWLQGAIHIARVRGQRREVIKVTTVLGCQVNWVEHEDHRLLRREG
jgi:hypothetical protein